MLNILESTAVCKTCPKDKLLKQIQQPVVLVTFLDTTSIFHILRLKTHLF